MADTTSFACVLCPRGCLLETSVQDNSVAVRGNACPRGEAYGRSEILDPRRSLTTTLRTSAQTKPRLPVRSSVDLPKARILEAMRALDAIVVRGDVRRGDVVVGNVLGLGIDIVATEDLNDR